MKPILDMAYGQTKAPWQRGVLDLRKEQVFFVYVDGLTSQELPQSYPST